MPKGTSNLIQHLTEFIEVKAERMKLKLASKSAVVFSVLLSVSVFLVITFFVLFFLSFGLANLINETLESSYQGFLIIAGFYSVCIMVVIWLFKHKVIQRLFETLFVRLLESQEDDETES